MFAKTIPYAFCILFLLGLVQADSVTIYNRGVHHAHLWCASGNGRIGGPEGIWVAPGNELGWSFGSNSRTLFWCFMDWNGQRYHWDVFNGAWKKHVQGHAIWTIKNDGIYNKRGVRETVIFE